MKVTATADGGRVYIAGEVYDDNYKLSGGRMPVTWTVSRYTENGRYELVRQDVLKFGQSKSLHGAKSIIAKLCRKYEREGCEA